MMGLTSWRTPCLTGDAVASACVADARTAVLAMHSGRFCAVRFREREVCAVWSSRFGSILAVQVASNGIVVALERATSGAPHLTW